MPMFPPEVHRSHLTPLRFLQRSASVFREKPAVIYGDRIVDLSRAGGAGQPPGLRPASPRASRAAIGSPTWCRTSRRCWRAISRSRWPGRFWWPSTRACRRPRWRTSSSTPGPRSSSSTPSSRIWSSQSLANLPDLELVVSVEDVPGGVRLPGPDYEAFLASGSPDPLDWPLEDEDETIAIDYTSGTTGRPKGVMYTHRGAYLNSLGELLETRMSSRQRLSLDAADVPLQWLVLPLGGDGHRRHPRLPAQTRTGNRLAADGERGRHPLLRRADGADRPGQSPRRRRGSRSTAR